MIYPIDVGLRDFKNASATHSLQYKQATCLDFKGLTLSF